MKELIEKRNELKTKSDVLAEIFKVSGADRDLSLVKKMGEEDTKDWTTVQKAEKIKKFNDELTDLGKDVDTLAEVEKADKASKALAEKLETPSGMVHPDADPEGKENGNGNQPQRKGIGTLFVESEQFKAHKPGDVMVEGAELKYGLKELKTLFQTSAGWPTESLRIGLLVEAVTRPIAVIDIIPSGVTGMAAIVYMEETTRTHAAAEKGEGLAFAESQFAFTERSVTVRKITDSIPVTDEQLADVPQVESYLNNRLSFGVRQRLDSQLLVGDGAGVNLEGILNKTGIQTQAKGGDPTPDAIYKAMTLVRVTGRAEPNATILHPNDWEPIRLLATADGVYIWGSPSEAGPERIWGIRIVMTTAETENTGLVGDFTHCQLFERQGIEVRVAFVNDDFTKGLQTIRASMRVGFPIYRATAFCTVTGI